MDMKNARPETIVLHAGYRAEQTTKSVAVPIYQTTSYQFDSTEHSREPFRVERVRQHL